MSLLEKNDPVIYKIFNIYNTFLDYIKDNISYL